MQDQMVRRKSRDGVVTLTLNNPSKRNALSTETLLELRDLFAEFERDDDVRVVVLRSEGPVFSSGHDLRELIDRDEAAYTEVFALCTEVMEAIRLLPKPVIAQVQGLATAAGCQLVATCDLAVAAESAAFCHARRPDRAVLHHALEWRWRGRCPPPRRPWRCCSPASRCPPARRWRWDWSTA